MGALIGVVWLTQALQQLDLMTNKGQTIWIFIQITWLILPKFIAFIAPIAALLAIIFTLNSLNRDSELVIMVNSGASPAFILKPLIILATLVAIVDSAVGHYFAPTAQRQVRVFFTEINSDLITSIIRPGEFASIEKGITFYVGSRDNNGVFQDVFVDDNRAADQALTYLAKNGAITRTTEGTFFVLQNGTIHRRPKDKNSISVIDYSSYAFDLSTFERQLPDQIRYRKPSENYTPYFLEIDENNASFVNSPGKYFAEFHNRFTSPLYSIVYALLAFFLLGKAKSTRQGNGLVILTTILSALALKGLGVATISAAETIPFFNIVQYVIPISAIAVLSFLIWRNVEAKVPERIRKWFGSMTLKVRRLFAERIDQGGAVS